MTTYSFFYFSLIQVFMVSLEASCYAGDNHNVSNINVKKYPFVFTLVLGAQEIPVAYILVEK